MDDQFTERPDVPITADITLHDWFMGQALAGVAGIHGYLPIEAAEQADKIASAAMRLRERRRRQRKGGAV